MRVPQPPSTAEELDLMKLLARYGKGEASWLQNDQELGPRERQACQELHVNLSKLVNTIFKHLLDRVTAREMQTFTMHDSGHGLKVAHLMWNILAPSRREKLSPVEIALLILSAHFHDLGMGLSDSERVARLDAASDLWQKVDIQANYLQAMKGLEQRLADETLETKLKSKAIYQLQQAQEALLCIDTRERHATPERYREILDDLQMYHDADPVRIPDIEACLSFDGDTFAEKLIDVCVSHNEDASALLESDPDNPGYQRFPTRFPVGCCEADLKIVAATLRLADIFDFDRERTPPILFHYLLPRSANPAENVSILEWEKHLTISNWEILPDAIVFHGRCKNMYTHHAVVEFCKTIEEEIQRTKSVFSADDKWPFILKEKVTADIYPDGYRYMPYQFELDDERIYALLMGNNIYQESLDAVRELIQNAVDACLLRDAMMRRHDSSSIPSDHKRIVVKYQEPNADRALPLLQVIDTGTGMDQWVIEQYLLKVGRSYYQSADFVRARADLRAANLDFAPVSEFGVGFLSCFMLADTIEVETALWQPIRGDTRRRLLRIDGLGRLIGLSESVNEGLTRIQGTKVTLYLSRGGRNGPPQWSEVRSYVGRVCQELPYDLYLEHVDEDGESTTEILKPHDLSVEVPEHLKKIALRIPVDDRDFGLQGEIILFPESGEREAERTRAHEAAITIHDSAARYGRELTAPLIRGGFLLGSTPGLPEYAGYANAALARIRLSWEPAPHQRYRITNLGRTRLASTLELAHHVIFSWLGWLLDRVEEFEEPPLGLLTLPNMYDLETAAWLEQYDAFTVYRLARLLWKGLANIDEGTLTVTAHPG